MWKTIALRNFKKNVDIYFSCILNFKSLYLSNQKSNYYKQKRKIVGGFKNNFEGVFFLLVVFFNWKKNYKFEGRNSNI